MTIHPRTQHSSAFTLVEMLVVIGIMSFLIALLMPALGKARAQAERIQCMSNMHQIGFAMLQYAFDGSNRGYLFPPSKGWPSQGTPPASPPNVPQFVAGTQQYDVWPYYVFKPHIWNPAYMICPSDQTPDGGHSYIANAHLLPISMKSKTNATTLGTYDIRYETEPPNHQPTSEIIVLGEKISLNVYDYYMDPGEFAAKVETHRHGLRVGSNYLMLDMHVETMVPPLNPVTQLDPWDLGG